MENQSDMRFKAGQTTGQAQAKKDEVMNRAREVKDEAGGYIQQTREQIKDMAQGAADTVKNTTGMGGSTNTKH